MNDTVPNHVRLEAAMARYQEVKASRDAARKVIEAAIRDLQATRSANPRDYPTICEREIEVARARAVALQTSDDTNAALNALNAARTKRTETASGVTS